MKVTKVNIVLLQKTHFTSPREVKEFKTRAGITSLHSFGEPRAHGVAILSSPKFRGKLSKYLQDDDGRVLTVEVVNEGNVYAPVDPKERKILFKNLNVYLYGRR